MTSSDRSSSQHYNITDCDDFRHSDSAPYPQTLSNEQSGRVDTSIEPAEVNERMSSVPIPRYNRPRRIELTSDQNGGAPEVADVHKFVVHEAATTSCNCQSEEVLLLQAVQTRHLARVCCFSL